jgi:hypothetical protein
MMYIIGVDSTTVVRGCIPSQMLQNVVMSLGDPSSRMFLYKSRVVQSISVVELSCLLWKMLLNGHFCKKLPCPDSFASEALSLVEST